jgi:hypothetical protein
MRVSRNRLIASLEIAVAQRNRVDLLYVIVLLRKKFNYVYILVHLTN